MKKFFYLAAIAATLVFSISSCGKKGCDAGYEGDPCQAFNLLHHGTYNGTNDCGGTSIVTVSEGTAPTGLIVDIDGDALNTNIYNENSAHFHLSSQTVGTITYSNINGEFTGDNLVMTFTVAISGSAPATCLFTGHK